MNFIRKLFGKAEAMITPPSENSAPAIRYLVQDDDHPTSLDRVLIFADGPGATQVISFELPLQNLRRNGFVSLFVIAETEFASMSPRAAERAVAALFDIHKPTVVVASRYGAMGAHAIVHECAARSIRLVTHLDDNLFAVPADLGEAKYRKYNDRARLSRLRLLCERSELVYASTGPLASHLRTLGVVTPVIAGDFYCAPPVAMKSFAPPKGAPVFGYMGTSGHAADLAQIETPIAAILKEVPEARFETFGTIKAPPALKAAFPGRVREIEATTTYLEFLEKLKALPWRCGLAPLSDTPFNECKADTKFVEYGTAGIPVVASDVGVYRQIAGEKRGRLARTDDDWRRAILSFLSDDVAAKGAVDATQAYLNQHYSMPALTAQVCKILDLRSGAIAN